MRRINLLTLRVSKLIRLLGGFTAK